MKPLQDLPPSPLSVTRPVIGGQVTRWPGQGSAGLDKEGKELEPTGTGRSQESTGETGFWRCIIQSQMVGETQKARLMGNLIDVTALSWDARFSSLFLRTCQYLNSFAWIIYWRHVSEGFLISFLLYLNVVPDSLYLKGMPTTDRDFGMYTKS